MKHYKDHFTIQQLRTKNLVKGVESLSAFIAAVIANMLIPQLLIKYIYDPTTLVATPPVFEYLPLVTYSLALLYFVFAMFGNFKRERKAKRMQREMGLYSNCCSSEGCSDNGCCSDEDEISDEELKELERIVDEALKPSKKKAVKKTSAKKTTKSAKIARAKKTTKKTAKKK